MVASEQGEAPLRIDDKGFHNAQMSCSASSSKPGLKIADRKAQKKDQGDHQRKGGDVAGPGLHRHVSSIERVTESTCLIE